MLTKILLLAIAGGLGTLARFGLSTLVQSGAGSSTFSYGTLAVNVLGCFLFGLVWSLSEARLAINQELKLIILFGFMGAFTTMSTFAFETASFMRDSQWTLAFINAFAQNTLSIAAVFVGFASSRIF
ncbi:MAG: CrcB family protein [Deltaproteobacteria bacterium]|nr:CrcB family protein [Deltaproteobacteria bacterium]